MMRLGPDTGPVVVLALPLFEEANRTRGVAVGMLRALAEQGIAGALPDLPGQGDSLVPTEAATLSDLRAAFGAALDAIGSGGRRACVAAIRSGALLGTSARAHGRWLLAPQDGPSLVRELARIAGHGANSPANRPSPVVIAGNRIAPALLAELADAADTGFGGPARIVRLAGDPRPADRHLPGAPPWRRAESESDTALSERLAADIADWMRSCDVR